MLESSEGLPLTVYFVIPSCVPATGFDESGAVLSADDIEEFYSEGRVLGLGEVMNYVGVVAGDDELEKKIKSALSRGLVVNGHAPLLSGKPLDKYISAGIGDDHE
ncbi:Adenine deaminase, partial [human gut metagenome]